MKKKPRTRLATGLAVLALGAASQVFGQEPSGQATPQARPRAQSGIPGGGTAPGQSGNEGMAPGSSIGGAPGSPSGAMAPGSTDAGTGNAGELAPGSVGAGAGGGAGEGLNPSLSSGLGGGLSGGGSYFGMIGDAPPGSRLQILARPVGIPQPPPLPRPGVPPGPPRFPRVGTSITAAVLPSVQQLKISENQSPAPQDRIYTSFNYFDNLNQSRNESLGSSIDHIKVYRYVLGFEKTFLDGRASAGMRLPIDTLTSSSRLPGFGGTSTAVGDLAAIFKYAFYQDRDTGSLASVGLMTSFPTGPNRFAGARGFNSFRDTALTPFVGGILNRGDLYIQGFSSLEIPTDQNQVTVLYNDIGLGYFVYRAPQPDRFLAAIAPTVELHVNTPLSHRGFGGPGNVLNGAFDVVDFTFGSNFLLGKRGVLTVGIVEPVTGPRPFTLEAIAQFNLRF
ncbi:MAG: hypothetical protein JWN86_2858 [Planctomycetota bacterium]|nr:hypothetical protein [Planctomycetota bacterium]